MQILRHLKPFLNQHKWRYILGIIALIIVDLLQLIPPKIIGSMTDSIKNSSIGMNQITRLGFIIIGIACLVAVFRYYWRMNIIGSARKLECWLRGNLFEHLEDMTPEFFNYRKTGDLMAHATNDIQAIRMLFGPGVIMTTDAIVITITTMVIMFSTINPMLTLWALIPLPIMAILVTFLGKKIQKYFRQVQEAFSGLSDHTQESISGIRVIKSFVREESSLQSFSKASEVYVAKNMKLAVIHGFMFPMIGFIASISFLIALLQGGTMVINGQLSLGDLVAFITYLGMLIWPMMAIGWVINSMQRGTASMKRINEILDTRPALIDAFDATWPEQFSPDIRFEDVSFKYPQSENFALTNIDFHIQKGKTLAIVGKTGSGKSSIASLILRFYAHTKGQIKISDISIADLKHKMLREKTGYVPQEAFLFSCSIHENIAFANPELSRERVIEVSKIAAIHDDIMSFPLGYDTMVGEKGVTLSGGQKQRIAIARALIKNPDILILDDCLSAVDTKTEEEILRHLQEVMKNKTSIIVSHRISAIKEADEILYLDDGAIVERGTHSELLVQKGVYEDLYRKQLLEEKIEKEA